VIGSEQDMVLQRARELRKTIPGISEEDLQQ